MGYWGTLVAVRAGEPPATLRGFGTTVRDEDRARRGDGWQVLSVADDLIAHLSLLADVVEETGHPVLAAYIADSDYGRLAGSSPSSGLWHTWLDRRTAYAFERDHQVMTGIPKAAAAAHAHRLIQTTGLRPTEAAQRVASWATDAGYRASASSIQQIIDLRRPPGISAWLRLPWARFVFAEEMFFAILDHLSVPRRPA
jgi:hypothetical protein